MGISFKSAKELRSRIEMLPSGPPWLSKEMTTGCLTIEEVILYYRNPLQCLQSLLCNPLFSDHLEFVPYRIYEDASKQVRIFSEWLSGNVSWEIQVSHICIAYCYISNILLDFTSARCNYTRYDSIFRQDVYFHHDWKQICVSSIDKSRQYPEGLPLEKLSWSLYPTCATSCRQVYQP